MIGSLDLLMQNQSLQAEKCGFQSELFISHSSWANCLDPKTHFLPL